MSCSRFLFLCLILLLQACAPSNNSQTEKSPAADAVQTAPIQPTGALPAPKGRIVAIGDLRGDLDATRRALRLAGAIDTKDAWIGKDLTVVQTGDQLDRGDQDKDIIDLLEKLSAQASQTGGNLFALNGNHEIMNAQGDFRYVSEGGFKSFAGGKESPEHQNQLSQLPQIARARADAFLPGGAYASLLAKRKSILILGENLFVHGGVLPAHVDYGLARMNQDFQDWLNHKSTQLPAILTDEQGPIWTRLYSDTQNPPACAQLAKALKKAGVKRMIVGHTVQPTINSNCENQVWRIDVGMSKAYGGPIQVLEINQDQVKVLKEKGRAE